MTTNLQSVHFDADKKLIDFANEKVNKLSNLYEGLINCEIILRLDKSSSNDNKVAEIKLLAKGFARIVAGKKNQLKYIYNSFLFLYLSSKGKFIKKFLGAQYTLQDVLQECLCKNNILLKLDIEGSEYDLFSSIIHIGANINMMVIELHHLNDKADEAKNFLENLSDEFAIVYLNLNPSGGNKNGLPNCIELTLVKRTLVAG